MYSLNVPVPADVARLAGDLARDLPGARARDRGEHTLVLKRLGDPDGPGLGRLDARVREALAGVDPFQVAVTGVDLFETPETGTGPVVYLAVESPDLVALHEHLCEHVDPVEHLEGEHYVPHVTVARGGDLAAARDLADREVDPVSWQVTDLELWDAARSLAAGRVALPA